MGIYSANRTGYMNTSMTKCNESYGSSDIGRIMYESEVNNQKLFDGILATDFSEIRGLREGTLLEAEAKAKAGASIKNVLSNIHDKLMVFWGKIKGAFNAIIQKIAAYILKDGKAFAEEFRKKYKKSKSYTGEIKDVYIRTDYAIKIPTVGELEKVITDNKNNTDLKSNDVVNKELGKIVNKDSITSKEFQGEIKNLTFIKGNVNANEIEKMLKTLEDASKTIKELKEVEKRSEKIIDETSKRIKKAEKDAKTDSKIIKNIGMLANAAEILLGCITRAAINVVKFDVKNSRSTLSKIKSELVAESYIMRESAAAVAEDEVDTALSDDIDTEVDSDTQEDIDAVVAAADAEVGEECGNNY